MKRASPIQVLSHSKLVRKKESQGNAAGGGIAVSCGDERMHGWIEEEREALKSTGNDRYCNAFIATLSANYTLPMSRNSIIGITMLADHSWPASGQVRIAAWTGYQRERAMHCYKPTDSQL